MTSGQARRRHAILAAAREMVQTGPISMRRLAELAGVSPATPYNLFGGKAQILGEIQAELIDEIQAEIDTCAAGDALDRMLFAIDRLAASLDAQPALHREIFATLYAGSSERAPTRVKLFWDRLMGDLRADGIVAPMTDHGAFTRNFIYMLSGALIEWADRQLDAASLAAAVRYGFILAAGAVAAEGTRPRLAALVSAANAASSSPPEVTPSR